VRHEARRAQRAHTTESEGRDRLKDTVRAVDPPRSANLVANISQNNKKHNTQTPPRQKDTDRAPTTVAGYDAVVQVSSGSPLCIEVLVDDLRELGLVMGCVQFSRGAREVTIFCTLAGSHAADDAEKERVLDSTGLATIRARLRDTLESHHPCLGLSLMSIQLPKHATQVRGARRVSHASHHSGTHPHLFGGGAAKRARGHASSQGLRFERLKAIYPVARAACTVNLSHRAGCTRD
jgi:hypothetical protein